MPTNEDKICHICGKWRSEPGEAHCSAPHPLWLPPGPTKEDKLCWSCLRFGAGGSIDHEGTCTLDGTKKHDNMTCDNHESVACPACALKDIEIRKLRYYLESNGRQAETNLKRWEAEQRTSAELRVKLQVALQERDLMEKQRDYARETKNKALNEVSGHVMLALAAQEERDRACAELQKIKALALWPHICTALEGKNSD